MLRKTLKDENGATLLEYVLIAAIIVLGVAVTFTTLKNSIVTKIQQITNTVNGL